MPDPMRAGAVVVVLAMAAVACVPADDPRSPNLAPTRPLRSTPPPSPAAVASFDLEPPAAS